MQTPLPTADAPRVRSLRLDIRFQAYLCMGPRDGRFSVAPNFFGRLVCTGWDRQNGRRRRALSVEDVNRIVAALLETEDYRPQDRAGDDGMEIPHYGYEVRAATARVEWTDGRTVVVEQPSDAPGMSAAIAVLEDITLR